MGTRGNVVILTESRPKGEPIVNIYQQYDSYPKGLGKTLASFLAGRKMVNGISSDSELISNTEEDLAAQIVVLMKTGHKVGGVYIQSCRDISPENDYTYYIYPERKPEKPKAGFFDDYTGKIFVDVYHWQEKVFSGNADEFIKWVETIK